MDKPEMSRKNDSEEGFEVSNTFKFKRCILLGAFIGFCWACCFVLFGIFLKESVFAELFGPLLTSFDLILTIVEDVFVKTGVLSPHDAITLLVLSFFISILLGIILGILIWLLAFLIYCVQREKDISQNIKRVMQIIVFVCVTLALYLAADRLMTIHKARGILRGEIGERQKEFYVKSIEKDTAQTIVHFVNKDMFVLGSCYLIILNNDGTHDVLQGE